MRRHKCEECGKVYECWLCTVHKEHKMHGGSRHAFLSDPTVPIYMCEKCSETPHNRYQRTNHASKIPDDTNPKAKYWDYLTGDIVTSKQIGRAQDDATRARNHRKKFLRDYA